MFKVFRNVSVKNVLLLLFIIEAFLLSGSLFNATKLHAASITQSALENLTNEERQNNGLPILQTNSTLTRAAQAKANDMAANSYFSHVSPQGKTPWYWFDMVGYNYKSAGENLAMNYSDSASVIQGWMNSPGHRANILKDSYTEVGTGIAEGTYNGTPTVFVVQLYGSEMTEARNNFVIKIVEDKTQGDVPQTVTKVQVSKAKVSVPSFPITVKVQNKTLVRRALSKVTSKLAKAITPKVASAQEKTFQLRITSTTTPTQLVQVKETRKEQFFKKFLESFSKVFSWLGRLASSRA